MLFLQNATGYLALHLIWRLEVRITVKMPFLYGIFAHSLGLLGDLFFVSLYMFLSVEYNKKAYDKNGAAVDV